MKVTYKILGQTTHEIEIDGNETISAIKADAEKHIEKKGNGMIALVSGRELKDDEKLSTLTAVCI